MIIGGRTGPLSSRWFPGPDHAPRIAYFRSAKRYVVCHAGRRAWKTETAKRRLIIRALTTPGRYLAAAPTYRQAKRIFWSDLKALCPRVAIADISDGELFIRVRTGAEIHVAGMDAPDRVEGQIWHHVLLDEYGHMAERVWPEVISPALADTGGSADIIGVPEGRNHYYDLVARMKGRADAAVFHWPSSDILDTDEIESQRSLLDERTFAQEFGGEFVRFAGQAYYAFGPENIGPARSLYDAKAPIAVAFDFNVDPGVAVICQERRLPNGLDGTAVIGEVWIPRSSNTELVARRLAEDWAGHEGRIELYGDYSGGARGSAKLQGSDWDIIRAVLRPAFPGRIADRTAPNPPVKARINALNARLRAANGERRMLIDPQFAPHVIKDLEGVALIEGAAGEIDKQSAPLLTHISDALGYYVYGAFALAPGRIGTLR